MNLLRTLGGALLATALVLGGCGIKVGQDKPGSAGAVPRLAPASTSGPFRLGEEIWRLIREHIATGLDPRTPDRLAVWDTWRIPFAHAIERSLPTDTTRTLLSYARSVLPLVDDGTVPGMVDDGAEILGRLSVHPTAPGAFAALTRSRAPLDARAVGAALTRVLMASDAEALLRGIALFVAEADGVDDAGRPNGEPDRLTPAIRVVASLLRKASAPSPTATGSFRALADLLCSPSGRRGTTGPGGPPAWTVRADARGLPRVLPDPVSGALPYPFVDLDGDGFVDVDTSDRFLDAAGLPFDLPIFDAGTDRDVHGRAIVAGNVPVYDYVDARDTVAGVLLAGLAEGLARDAGNDLLAVTSAVLGPRVRHDAGTPTDPRDDYDAYRADGPAADLLHALLLVMAAEENGPAIEALAAVLDHDPQAAEAAIARSIEGFRRASNAAATATPVPGGVRRLLDDLTPILDQVFERSGGTSTARVVVDAFARQGRTLQGIPPRFADLMRFTDYKSRVPTSPGNRSEFEGLLEMVSASAHCTAPLIGNLAEFYIELMAGKQRKILGITLTCKTVNRLIQIPFLRSLLCHNMHAQHVQALLAFTDSGAVDAFRPIVAAFVDRGETGRFKDLLVTLAGHYPTVLRPLEPKVAAVLASGGVEPIFEVLGWLSGMRTASGIDVADALTDALGVLVDDDAVYRDRRGRRARTLTHLIIDAFEAVENQVTASGGRPAFERLLDLMAGPLTSTVPGPALANPSVVPLGARVLSYLAATREPDPARRAQAVVDGVKSFEDFLAGPEIGPLLDTAEALRRSPAGQRVHDALLGLLRPNGDPGGDAYGGIAALMVGGLGARVDGAALAEASRFLGEIIEPGAGAADRLVRGTVRLAVRDDGSALYQTLRGLFDAGPMGTEEPAISIFLRAAREMRDAGNTTPVSPITGADLAAEAAELARTIRDPAGPVQQTFERIKARPGP